MQGNRKEGWVGRERDRELALFPTPPTSVLKMETVFFSESLLSTCESTRRQNSEQEDGCILGCCAVQSGRSLPTFQRYLLPPSSGRLSLLLFLFNLTCMSFCP
jgi:hypothetical protein